MKNTHIYLLKWCRRRDEYNDMKWTKDRSCDPPLTIKIDLVPFLQPEQEMTHIPASQRVNASLATRNIAFRAVHSTGMRQ
jgi:hypothetical protein